MKLIKLIEVRFQQQAGSPNASPAKTNASPAMTNAVKALPICPLLLLFYKYLKCILYS